MSEPNDWRVVLMIYVGGALLVLVRRWGNPDPYAGMWIAGFTLFLLFCYLKN